MRKWWIVILAVLFIAGAVQLGLAKSKVWDLVFGEEQQAQAYTVELKMSSGETFDIETAEANYDDVTFEGPIKLERPDGTYYLNSAQVSYIKVVPKQ